MNLTLLIYEIYIPHSHSLKEKRKVVKSLKQKLRNRFNISVSEIDYTDLWQKSSLAVALVTSEGKLSERIITEIDKFIYATRDIQILTNERTDY